MSSLEFTFLVVHQRLQSLVSSCQWPINLILCLFVWWLTIIPSTRSCGILLFCRRPNEQKRNRNRVLRRGNRSLSRVQFQSSPICFGLLLANEGSNKLAAESINSRIGTRNVLLIVVSIGRVSFTGLWMCVYLCTYCCGSLGQIYLLGRGIKRGQT